jgi:hypothetical protein
MDDVPTVFTNMHSLLNPPKPGAKWPIILTLAPLDFFEGSPDLALMNRTVPASTSSSTTLKSTGEERTRRSRKIRKVMTCAHPYRKYYAKGMCTNCYHKFGRVKKATKCPHSESNMYAKGMCQTCYLHHYHILKVPRTLASRFKLQA